MAGFIEGIGKFLKLPSRKDVEQLKEKVATQELLLRDFDSPIAPKTSLSSFALEQRPVEDVPGVVSRMVTTRLLQKLYLTNQFIFRGVNVRADELITRGYDIEGEDEKGITACKKLIDDSGGTNLFWQISVNTDVAGDGYLEKVPNVKGNKILLLKHVNPVNFGFTTDKTTSKIIINDRGTPKSYTQVVYGNDGVAENIEVPIDRIAHLRFNTFGDEFTGISSLQPVYNTTIRLMNMEHAAAEAAVKTANPIIVGQTETKNPNELRKWSGILSHISAQEQVFLPAGVKLSMLSPGYQNFNAYAAYFLDAVVAALGVPKSILTGSSDSGGGNRSTVQIQSRHFYSVIRANQRYVEILFNDIFKDYAEKAGFKAPTLHFKDIAEDADVKGQRAIELYDAGVITLEESRSMIGLETTKNVKAELSKNMENKANIKKVGEDKDLKVSDKKAFFPAKPGSPAGSQRGIKKQQKINPDVPSVK